MTTACLGLLEIRTHTKSAPVSSYLIAVTLFVYAAPGCVPTQFPVPAVQSLQVVARIRQVGIPDANSAYNSDDVTTVLFADSLSLPRAFVVEIVNCETSGYFAGTVQDVYIDQDTVVEKCSNSKGKCEFVKEAICDMTLTRKETNLTEEVVKLNKTCWYVSKCRIIDEDEVHRRYNQKFDSLK